MKKPADGRLSRTLISLVLAIIFIFFPLLVFSFVVMKFDHSEDSTKNRFLRQNNQADHEISKTPHQKNSVINDNYCDDVSSGTDEHRTSACSFFSVGRAYFTCGDGVHIFNSRVGDGVVDCVDGSDESISIQF